MFFFISLAIPIIQCPWEEFGKILFRAHSLFSLHYEIQVHSALTSKLPLDLLVAKHVTSAPGFHDMSEGIGNGLCQAQNAIELALRILH